MLKRLLHLKMHVTAVLADPALTPKPEHRALLLKEKRWAVAKELVTILKPAEKATALLSGQKYLTVSSVLPIVTSLRNLANAAAARLGDESKPSLSDFATSIGVELSIKFHLEPIDVCSPSCVAAALHPRSRSLGFLRAGDRNDLQQEILRRSTAYLPASDTEPAAKRAPVSEDDISLFFGDVTDDQVSTSTKLQNEVAAFFTEAATAAPASAYPLEWWRKNGDRLPNLEKLARALLCVPATSVPSERVFSAAGYIVNKLRAALSL
eukprot:scpid56897/ scgid26660/ 